jgi:aspartyl/asparaginyl beta-hydroxylase (cupin superfamily)
MENFAYLLLKVPNALYRRSMSWASRPVLYPDVGIVCRELQQLEAAFPAIKQEYLAVRDKLHLLPRYHDLDRLQYEISASNSTSTNWKVFFLQAMGQKAKRHCRECPITSSVIEKIPGVFQAFFSILEGGKSIPTHSSPYWGYLRYHLALEVPKDGPEPRMRVGSQWMGWHEGRGFLFDDSWDHELVNANPKLRSVLIVDIARPMGPLCSTVHVLMQWVMGQTYGRWVLRRSAI